MKENWTYVTRKRMEQSRELLVSGKSGVGGDGRELYWGLHGAQERVVNRSGVLTRKLNGRED